METEINWETVARSRTYLECDPMIMTIEMLELQYDLSGKNTFWAAISSSGEDLTPDVILMKPM
jgi:hypothetical protein